MGKKVVGNYVRVHRRRAGLSQTDLATIVGHAKSAQIARHERNQSIPPLLTAFAYEVIFDVPMSRLFPGLWETVAAGIEISLDEFEKRLERQPETDRPRAVAHQLVWLANRRKARQSRQTAP